MVLLLSIVTSKTHHGLSLRQRFTSIVSNLTSSFSAAPSSSVHELRQPLPPWGEKKSGDHQLFNRVVVEKKKNAPLIIMITMKQRRVTSPRSSFVIYVLMRNQSLICSKRVSVSTPFALTAYQNTWWLKYIKVFSRSFVQTPTVMWNLSLNICVPSCLVMSLIDGNVWDVSLWFLGRRRLTALLRIVRFCWWIREEKLPPVLSVPLVIGDFVHIVRLLGMEGRNVRNSKGWKRMKKSWIRSFSIWQRKKIGRNAPTALCLSRDVVDVTTLPAGFVLCIIDHFHGFWHAF